MKTIRNRLIAGAFGLAVAAPITPCLQAQPADPPYYYPPSSGAPAGGYYAPFNDKLYLGLDAGAALLQDTTISDSIGDSEKVTFSPGARMDVLVGYEFTKHWAAELELGLIANDVSHSTFLGTDYMGVTYLQLPMLVNGIYTLPLNQSKTCSAYFGAGIGGVFSKYMNEFGEETPGDSAFAYQGQAGIKWAVSRRCEAGVAYKFLGTTGHDVGPGWDSNGNPTEFKSDGTMTHSILATLTIKF